MKLARTHSETRAPSARSGTLQAFSSHAHSLLIPVYLLLVFGLWQLIIRSGEVPTFLVPAPSSVWRKLQVVLENGTLWRHTSVTLQETAYGFVGALIFAAIIGYILAKSTWLEKLISPYLVAAQTVPLIALAPLLVIMLGFGLPSKVFIAFVIAFFPMLVNTIVGIRLVDEEQRELMRSYSASAWQVFARLEVPSALPLLLGGLKVGITLAISGAMVGEYVGARAGLGYMIVHSKESYDTPQVFVTIFTVMIVNVILFSAVTGLESILLANRKGAEG
ncbi:MAG: ABC transporter permease [Anaerolineales bacterium]|nr:ABC transporter permease [Anaerolineales bacterium]